MLSHVETQLQRNALLVLTGDKDVTSFLDSITRSSDVYEINGTNYKLSGSTLRSHDYTDYARVTKIGNEKRVLFNLAATEFSDVFYPNSELNDAMVCSSLHELTAAVNILTVDDSAEYPFTVSLARDRLHQYICKFLIFVIFLYNLP